jgi:hypothetical protein
MVRALGRYGTFYRVVAGQEIWRGSRVDEWGLWHWLNGSRYNGIAPTEGLAMRKTCTWDDNPAVAAIRWDGGRGDVCKEHLLSLFPPGRPALNEGEQQVEVLPLGSE